jgi:uncharacterized protein
VAKFFNFLLPKNQHFFNLFYQSTSNSVQMAELLYQTISSETPHDEKMYFNQIGRLKTNADDLKRQMYTASSKSLIAPFERNDLYSLASVINQVGDSMHVAARRVSLYQLQLMEPAMKELAGLIIETCTELHNGVNALNNLKNTAAITACCNKIKELEAYADRVYNKALSGIAANQTNFIEVIKYTEILAALEYTTDKCEDATEVIESIVIKNA